MVFISHANPEDNEFTLWLALRLAREGYPVWCDLTKLLGGETFWRDIESALRDRTIKFLFVLSRNSNSKEGVLNELDLALGLERRQKLPDFVIPLRLDSLPHNDIQIQIRRKNAIDFSASWASGFSQLLRKLTEDSVPRDARFDANAVNSWWQEARQGDELLKNESDSHVSNWFPLTQMPQAIYVHTLRSNIERRRTAWDLAHPAHLIGDYMVSFAPKSDFQDLVAGTNEVAFSYAIDSNDPDLPLTAREYRNCAVRLLRLAWDRAIDEREMPTHPLARRRKACFFTDSMYSGSRLSYALPDGLTGSRALVGFKTVWNVGARQKAKRYWHFAISADARLNPIPVILLNSHIVFSDDGKTVWDSPKRLHSARRSQGGGWWNDDWRDRLLAAVNWIAGPNDCIELPVSSKHRILVSPIPVSFDASVSYSDEFARHADPIEVVPDETSIVETEDDPPDSAAGDS